MTRLQRYVRKINWTATSTLIAALALAAGLFFNGVQVRDGAAAQRQARIATELGLLTQLQGTLSQSVYSRVPYAQQFRELRLGDRAGLTAPAYRATAEEAANIDYFAWLFNNGYITTPGSERLWGPRMICEYQHAFAPAFEEAARDLPDLITFIQRRGPSLAQLERC
jgi:hypothetical protein